MPYPVVKTLPPPLNCVYCGRIAQYLVDGTSTCRMHYSDEYKRATTRRRQEAADA